MTLRKSKTSSCILQKANFKIQAKVSSPVTNGNLQLMIPSVSHVAWLVMASLSQIAWLTMTCLSQIAWLMLNRKVRYLWTGLGFSI
uniref:Uncharacterized protein n=1 Tax=Oryza brachyantha TaxID=4533 RepID=J3LI69_ORYBR